MESFKTSAAIPMRGRERRSLRARRHRFWPFRPARSRRARASTGSAPGPPRRSGVRRRRPRRRPGTSALHAQPVPAQRRLRRRPDSCTSPTRRCARSCTPASAVRGCASCSATGTARRRSRSARLTSRFATRRRRSSRRRLAPLTFSGKPTFTIPPGAVVYSDPVNLTVPQMSDLAIDLYPARRHQHAGAADDAHRRVPDQLRLGDGQSRRGGQASDRGDDAELVRRPSSGSRGARIGRRAGRRSATRSPTARARRRTPTTAGPITSCGGCCRSRRRSRMGVMNAGIAGNRVLSDAALQCGHQRAGALRAQRRWRSRASRT